MITKLNNDKYHIRVTENVLGEDYELQKEVSLNSTEHAQYFEYNLQEKLRNYQKTSEIRFLYQFLSKHFNIRNELPWFWEEYTYLTAGNIESEDLRPKRITNYTEGRS